MVVERLRRYATVRVTAAIGAVAVVAVALAVSGVMLVVLLRSSLEGSIQTALELRANDIASVVAAGSPPPLLATRGEDTSLAQVVDGTGRVIAASANIEGEAPIASLRPSGAKPMARTMNDLPIGESQRFRVVALAAPTATGPMTVYVASSLATVDDAVGTVTRVLLVGFPLLLVVVAVTTWRAAGRSLRPVDAIRARFEDLSTGDLHRRVAEPPTSDEIGRLARTVNVALDRLEATAARQRRFIADASHELRSPLTSLRAELEVARVHPETVDWNQLRDDLRVDTARLEDLVSDLLVLARLDVHPPRDQRPVDLANVVNNQIADLPRRPDVTVTTCYGPDRTVLGDEADLARLVRNLVDNAARQARRRVSIDVHRHDNRIRLDVDDDGPGIAPEDRARVLEPFTRLDPARGRADGGSGLGLAIVNDIVRAHAAALTIDTSDLGGARFRVEFAASGPLHDPSHPLHP